MLIDNATILNLAKQCSPTVAPTTMLTLVKTESGKNPIAIGLNGARLLAQPKNQSQAIAWIKYLDKHNYNFDVGLGQINIKNIRKYKLQPEALLNPCLNLKISGEILTKNYIAAKKNTKDPQYALRKALSTYNTGNQYSGFNNGYVVKVLKNIETK
ncbi:MAG: lytic transglycosylase domain-containing protein [Burkholderiales bacterium]|nr:lytic transglycosylase domain-containing protein [Burkholderiales bacterium]